MKFVKIEDVDCIVNTAELAEMLGVTPREIQLLTTNGFLTPLSNYKKQGCRTRFYRLTLALRQYERYFAYYRGRAEEFATKGCKGEPIKIISDCDPLNYKGTKEQYLV